MSEKKYKKSNSRKKIALGLTLVALFLIVAFSTYQICLLLLPNSEIFNKTHKKQNTYYTNNNSIEQNNTSNSQVKEPTEDYKKGMDLLNKKDYYNAYLRFQNVKNSDSYYNESLSKIKECQQAYEQIKFAEAKEFEKKQDYKSAIECMDSILKINSEQVIAADSKAKYDNLNKEKIKQEAKNAKKTEKRKIDISKTIRISGGAEPKGDSVPWAFTNVSDKTISNIYFYRNCGSCYKSIEPIKPNEFSYYKESIECYNSNNCPLVKVIIEYTDGDKITIPREQIKYLGDQAQLKLKIDNQQMFVKED